MKEKWNMWVPILKNKKLIKKFQNETDGDRRERVKKKEGERFLFLFLFFLSRFSLRYMEIGPAEFVGPRKKSALLDEGYV